MKRSKFSLSCQKLLTCDMGELVPIGLWEVLPGDVFRHRTSLMVRLMPLMSPVYHQAVVRVHHWFVPTRLLWDDWEDFITGGINGTGAASAYPYFQATAGGVASGTLSDYFGIPVGAPTANMQFSALPHRAYAKIFNERYRDQDLVPAVVQSTAGGQDTTTNAAVLKCGWEKDRFSTARPWPQRGPEVTLPIGNSAPVLTSAADQASGAHSPMRYKYAAAGAALGTTNLLGGTGGTGVAYHSNVGGGGNNGDIYPSNLLADLSTAGAVPVNDLRLALALQRYQERLATRGSRYSEYLRSMGIRSSDARLQEPEYLGGGKSNISFGEVLQTGPDGTGEGVANLKGHGISALSSRRYQRFFEEHGYVISLLSVRPRAIYGEALDRMWSRRVKEDYWTPELQTIGQQEVYRREIYGQSDANGGNTVFGWQDRYDEYRRTHSDVAGDFRTTLNFWHMARQFGSPPALNSDFINCNPTKRIFAEQTQDCLQVLTAHSLHALRLVSADARPRII